MEAIKIGRPPKWNNPEELKVKLEEYFNSVPQDKWIWTGLAVFLGTSKQLLDNYLEKEDFKDIIIMAKLMVESSYEAGLKEKGRAGEIFALKNYGWKDKQEVDMNISGELKLSSLSDEDE